LAKAARILVVDDDPNLRQQLQDLLSEEGFEVAVAADAREARRMLPDLAPDLAITDLKLPDADGLSLLESVYDEHPHCPVLVLTGHGSVPSAIEAMRRNAFYYLQKPIAADQLLLEVTKGLEYGRVLRERSQLRRRLSSVQGLGQIVGKSEAVAEMKNLIEAVAGTEATVFVVGPTGSGKELVADALHYASPRAAKPLIKINCAAISAKLLESELFGHERGAFTGAEGRRRGRFEQAAGGTLFLDEITDMDKGLQAKLLHVLQGQAFYRLGGNEEVTVDTRVVAATNRDPDKAVEDGKLRQDLYYRLNVIRIDVPPLARRRQDVPLLAEHFRVAFNEKHGKNIAGFTDEAMKVMMSYSWPGNVRELENALERAVLLCDKREIGAEHLTALEESAGNTGNGDGEEEMAPTLNLRDVERHTIVQALQAAGGNKVQAAKRLGIYTSSLYKKMKRLDIDDSEVPGNGNGNVAV
jgi:DNA-binding NtrC family response regulator